MKNIPVNRFLIYLLSLGLLPLLLAALFFMSQKSKIEDLQQSIESTEYQAFLKEKKQAQNVSVRQHFRDADHFYIDKYLESLTFLEPEIEGLQKIANDRNFAGDERIKRRLEYLTGPSNNLAFSEGVVQTFPLFQETMETLVHPVEVNASDLLKILSRVEGIELESIEGGVNRPQLIVTEFKIDKKKVNESNEVYQLNMKLLKREFL